MFAMSEIMLYSNAYIKYYISVAWRKYQISNIMIMININAKHTLSLFIYIYTYTYTYNYSMYTTLRCIIKIIATINILSAYK